MKPAGHEAIGFDEYQPTIRLLDETEKHLSIAQIAHGTATALTAGVAAIGSLGVGAGILALGVGTAPKGDAYYFLHVSLNDGRQAVLIASQSAFKKIQPFINI